MKKINDIVDLLSPVEKNLMYNKLQKELNRGPEYIIKNNRDGYSIVLKGNDGSIKHTILCNYVFETPEMAHLAYSIYLNTKNNIAYLSDNIRYVFRLLNINSEWTK